MEFPLTALELLGVRVPAASGAYLRLLPGAVHHAALRRYAARGVPAVVNVHPWELDPGQPRIQGSWRARWAHYSGLGRTASVLESLFSAFRFAPLRECLGLRPTAAAAAE